MLRRLRMKVNHDSAVNALLMLRAAAPALTGLTELEVCAGVSVAVWHRNECPIWLLCDLHWGLGATKTYDRIDKAQRNA